VPAHGRVFSTIVGQVYALFLYSTSMRTVNDSLRAQKEGQPNRESCALAGPHHSSEVLQRSASAAEALQAGSFVVLKPYRALIAALVAVAQHTIAATQRERFLGVAQTLLALDESPHPMC